MHKTLALIFMGLAFHLPVRAGVPSSLMEAGRLGYVNILQGTDSHVDLSHGNTLPLVGAPW